MLLLESAPIGLCTADTGEEKGQNECSEKYGSCHLCIWIPIVERHRIRADGPDRQIVAAIRTLSSKRSLLGRKAAFTENRTISQAFEFA